MTTKEEQDKQAPDIDLQQFRGGTHDRYQCRVNSRVIFSGGVRYLAEKANAFWLVDTIGSYLVPEVLRSAIQRDGRIRFLHFWQLRVREDQSAVLSALVDTGEPPFVVQKIAYTDIPLREVDIWAGHDGGHWTLYLPQEH